MRWLLFFIFFMLLFGVAFAADIQYLTASYYSRQSLIDEGTAKYNPRFIMANGRVFKDDGLTAACNSLRLGDRVRVTNLRNGKSVVVLVTDRTARRFKGKRIDLSISAMRQIDGIERGLEKVKVEVI